MKNSKKTVGIILLTCIVGVILIFAPKYIFAAVKTALDTYQDKKEALRTTGYTMRMVVSMSIMMGY